ncbi:MAG: hypothetical protein P8L37_05955 [Phycisphaerales bacterium]|nr:hypothetical protein [Phycisphaerales bacterium]
MKAMICTLTRDKNDRIIPLTMTNFRNNQIARPRAIAKAAPKRSKLHDLLNTRPAVINAVATLVMLPWSIYCCFTHRRTGPKRRI